MATPGRVENRLQSVPTPAEVLDRDREETSDTYVVHLPVSVSDRLDHESPYLSLQDSTA